VFLLRSLVILLVCAVWAEAIVSIAPVVIGQNPGFSGKAEASFETKRGNTDSDNYGGGVRLTYDNNSSYVTWGEFSANYAAASGTKNTDNSFAHLRYIHRLTPKRWAWEAFVQSQTNEFTKIKERFLSGGGARLHLKDNTLGNLFFGMGGFYEHISYSTVQNPAENNIRISLYASYVKHLTEGSEFSYVGYYQPRVNGFSDYLLSNAAELTLKIYRRLFLSFKFSYDYDSKPAVGVKTYDMTQNTSFIYKF
jgi:putative salt-induced outer membrane protein YdiY